VADHDLMNARTSGVPLVLTEVLRGPAAEVGRSVANLKDDLEAWLGYHPDDYAALVLLGELNLRVGLKRSARSLLYRATLLKPPSWEAYQRTALLLRRAEAEQALELERVAGAPPPLWLRRLARALAAPLRLALTGPKNPLREVLE
jgi:hypothetical protein